MSGENQIVACRLYEKTSAGGNRYFVGLMGGVRVLLFFDQKQTDENQNGDPIWNMVFQPADKLRSDDKKREAPRQKRAPEKKRDDSRTAHSAASQYQAPLDDPLPDHMRG